MPSGTPDLRLRVSNREYGGWKTVVFIRGIEAISGMFELSVFDRWGGQTVPWPIREEDECSLVVGGKPVITGYVDKRRLTFDAESHQLSVVGRDRTGEMVDCSAVLDKWEFINSPVVTLAKKLAEPFGVSVSVQPGLELKPIPKLAIDPGDTAFDALEKACRMSGVLLVADGLGGLMITRAGSTRAVTELVEGENIKAASGDYDGSNRFRTYRVLGQSQGTDEFSGKAAARVRGEAKDETVRRAGRILLIRPEGNVDTATAKRRAEWEATVRAARSYSVQVTVQGWTQGDGSLWPVNALVPVRSPFLGLDTDMLITEVRSSLDDVNGSLTVLTLKRPDAFIPQPVIRVSTKAGTSKKTAAPWSELAGGVEVGSANYSTASGQSIYVPPAGGK